MQITKRILAVDVGFKSTGVAVMEKENDYSWRELHVGCIRPPVNTGRLALRKAEADVARTMTTARDLHGLIDKYLIERIVVELPHGGALNGRAMRAMGLASGMIATIVQVAGLACEWYTPRETRVAATGRPNATKDEVMYAMADLYPKLKALKHKVDRENAADALATFEACKVGNLIKL